MSNHYSPTTHYIGLDLGQARDPTAVVVVERSEISLGVSPVTFERLVQPRYSFRHLERMPLGLDYPSQVDHVRDLVQRPEFSRSSTSLIVDATGVGRPVVDLLRRAALPCRLIPVIITGGDKETSESGIWHVPKRDLMTGLLVLFQRGEIEISGHLPEIKVSLSGQDTYATWREGQHDDLVLAAALACWHATRPTYSLVGAGRLL